MIVEYVVIVLHEAPFFVSTCTSPFDFGTPVSYTMWVFVRVMVEVKSILFFCFSLFLGA